VPGCEALIAQDQGARVLKSKRKMENEYHTTTFKFTAWKKAHARRRNQK
jgi:hypothetical protein